MASPAHLVRSPPTCLSCLRRLASPSTRPTTAGAVWTTQQQTRTKMTKAELEDLQGIPVRLLRDIPAFGRKDAIIRVKAGRMRNIWFPRAAAEYMTRKRFEELGLTEAAIGVRDRTFGTKLAVVEDEGDEALRKEMEAEAARAAKKRAAIESLSLQAEEVQALLQTILPPTITFARRPVVQPEPAAPAPARSPSIAADASVSQAPVTQPTEEQTIFAIFGSVSKADILQYIRDLLMAEREGAAVALEAESIELVGLHPSYDGVDRIKRLGRFEVLISLGVDSNGMPTEPVRRFLEVVPEVQES